MAIKRTNRIKNMIGLLLLPIVLFLLLRWFERSTIFQPTRRLDVSPHALNRPFENVQIDAAGTLLHAWSFPSTPGADHSDKVFLVCHGNAGNISHRLDLATVLLDTGAAVLLFDYRGYGRSAGKPSEAGLYEDARAAYDYLVARGFAGTNIIGFGESLGGAVVVNLATERRLGGVALLSTFTSSRAVADEIFPWLPSSLAAYRFDSLSKIAKVKAPVAILHSRQDTIINFTHAQKLFAAAHEPKAMHEIVGDHNDTLDTSIPTLTTAIHQLLNASERRVE